MAYEEAHWQMSAREQDRKCGRISLSLSSSHQMLDALSSALEVQTTEEPPDHLSLSSGKGKREWFFDSPLCIQVALRKEQPITIFSTFLAVLH